MGNNGNRFKTENDEPIEVVTAESLDSVREEEKLARKREKQSKKIEKLMEKKRKHEDRSSNDAPEDAESTEPSSDDDADQDAKDEQLREAERDERLKERNSKKLEKLLQKQRRRERRSDREVLSYEDVPLDERKEASKKSNTKLNKKRIILAGVIVLLLVALVFLFTNSDRLSLHNITNFIQYGIFNRDSDQRFPVETHGETITTGNFVRMGQDLCYASDTKLQTLNNYGKRMLTVQHGYTQPVLVACEKRSLLYNLGGTGFQINGLDEHIYDGTAENKIIVADIINSGAYALVTRSDGYLSKLYVYDSDNNKIFAYSFADYYITSVSLKSNGKMAVLSGISAHNGSEIACLYVLDFTKEKPVQFVELEETLIYEVQYLSDTYAAAIGSSGAYVIHTGNGSVEKTDYEGKTLTAYTVNTNTETFSIALSRSADGRNCDIYSFSTSGSLSKSFSTDLRVIAMSSYKGRVALMTTDTVYLYSKGGSFVGKTEAGIDPRGVVMYTSADAYVLDTSEIRSVSL